MLKHPRCIAAAIVAAGLVALPACKKKSSSGGTDNSPPPPYPGAKGPPGGPQPGGPGRGPLNSYNRAGAQNTVNNLKQIGLACHNFHDATGTLPNAIADADGKPGLSWRVAILPYLNQTALYRQFKLDEPWDSEHNKKLIPQMPALFASPGSSASGQTYYRSFTGQGAVMPAPAGNWKPGQPFRGSSLTNITDGTANTFLVAEAAEPVIWTKPEELPFAPGKPPKLGGTVYGEGFHAILCDGSVRFFRSSLDARTLSNAIQINDGQIVILD